MKKIYNWIIITIMLIIDVFYIGRSFALQSYGRLLTYMALPFILLLPFLYEKFFHKKIDENLKILYYTFVFIADCLGCVVGLYETTTWFDIVAHYLSGVLTALLAIIIMKNMKYKETKFSVVIYVLSVTCLVAFIWESFEFAMDTFAGMNLQHVKETGVGDTMEDSIVAFVGAITFLITYFLSGKKGKLYKFITDIKI